MTLEKTFFFIHPGWEVPVSRRIPTEDHPCYCQDVFLHGQSHEDTTAAAGLFLAVVKVPAVV